MSYKIPIQQGRSSKLKSKSSYKKFRKSGPLVLAPFSSKYEIKEAEK